MSGRETIDRASDEEIRAWIDSLGPRCLYCREHARIQEAAAADDEAGWAERAEEHQPDCEWVLTRAHTRTFGADDSNASPGNMR